MRKPCRLGTSGDDREGVAPGGKDEGNQEAPSLPLQELVCGKGGRFVLSYSRKRRNKAYASSVPMERTFLLTQGQGF